MTARYYEGQFVTCNFPYKEAPTQPGQRRIGYIHSVDRKTNPDSPTALVLYTTTSDNWMRQNEGREGYFQFDEVQARRMGQDREFMIEAVRVARLPLNQTFFPEINNRSNRAGVVGAAPKAVQQEITSTLIDIAKNRPHTIDRSGPPLSKPTVATVKTTAPAATGPRSVVETGRTAPSGRPVLGPKK